MRRLTTHLCAVLFATALVAGSLPAAPAIADTSLALSASLHPEHLGKAANVGVSLRIAGSTPPAPVRDIDVRYPESLSLLASGLGIRACSAEILQISGPAGCSPDSVMGHGSALAVVPFGPKLIGESVRVTIVRAESDDGYLAALLYAQGLSPVGASVLMSAQLLPSHAPYGGRLEVAVPLIPSLPEAEPVRLVSLRATLGARGLTYHERVGGREVAYTPRGISLPDRCPRGGFSFAATLTFEDGTLSSAHTRVPCPARAAAGAGTRRPAKPH